MSLSEKFSGMMSNVQDGAKNASVSFFHRSLRLVSGLMIGVTVGLIAQELIGFSSFGLTFFTVTMCGVIYKVLGAWTLSQILIFDLICVLVAQLLKMYILLAP